MRSVIGVDLTPEMVDLATKLAKERGFPNVDCRRGDAEELPFETGRFDLVTCRAAFDHLASPEKALSEMKRVVARPDGSSFTNSSPPPSRRRPRSTTRLKVAGTRRISGP